MFFSFDLQANFHYYVTKQVASGQVASSGVAIMNYVHKVTNKVGNSSLIFIEFD